MGVAFYLVGFYGCSVLSGSVLWVQRFSSMTLKSLLFPFAVGPKNKKSLEIAKLWYGIIRYNLQSLLPYVEIGVAQPRPFSKIEFREKSSASKYYWRPPSHWRPPWTSRWRPPDMRDPNLFIGNLGVSNEKFGVFNKNMGSLMKSLGSPIKIWGSPTRIWGLQRYLHGVSDERGSPMRKVFNSTPMLMIFSPASLNLMFILRELPDVWG